jgi:hypothetical protein
MILTAKIMDLSSGLAPTGRQYDPATLKDAIERFNASGNKSVYISDTREGQVPGELTHSLANIVGRVSDDVKIKADGLWADVELLDTPTGSIMQELHNAGTSLNFAPRIAIKETECDENGEPTKVIKRADIISVDLVSP